MHNKLYSFKRKIGKETKRFFVENYRFLIVYAFIISLFLIPTKYEIYTPGSLLDVSKRVEVENSYDTSGSMNITYVKSRGDSIAMVGISYIIPNWDLEKKSKLTLPKEDYKDSVKRNKIELKGSNEKAIVLAYEKADKKIEIKDKKLVVNYVLPDSKSSLKVGDIITKVDGEEVENYTDLRNYLEEKEENDEVTLEIIRDKNKKEIKTKLIKYKDRISIGIYLTESYKIKTKPKVEINYKENESGSSAGLMTTLYIYNSLTPIDLTKGLKIAGTGAINSEGKVEEISGVKYKLIGAVKKKADIMLVPEENYKEAIKIKKKKKYKIKIISVDSFDDAVEKLEDF